MKILIKSRNDTEKMSKSEFGKGTALISITDAGSDFAVLIHKPDYLLQIAFDDVDNDIFIDELGRTPSVEERQELESKYKMLSDEQALQIASFYTDNKDSIATLICQCEHGQSRSAAVAAAIMEFRSRRGIMVFAHDNYYPNKVVFRKVLDALKDCIPVYDAKPGDLRKESND